VSQVIDSLDSARAAAARQVWRDAYAAYTDVEPEQLTASDLEQYGEAAWWTGKRDEAVALRQRAYAGYVAGGDKRSAARIALALAWDHLASGAFAVFQGWLAKAERQAAAEPDSIEQGFVVVTRAFGVLFGEGDVAKALPEFEHAYELSQRLGDPDLEAMALTGKGKALVDRGEVDAGLALLDEATAAATSGGLRPFAAGFVYCCTIDSCQQLGDYRRAAEWTDAANRWCENLDVSGMPGACRVHRASIMRLQGHWPEAEQQALSACEEVRDFNAIVTAFGYYEIGEIRRRRGDFAAAAEAYANANELGYEPQPGLALLQLAEGKVEAALAGVRSALAHVEAPLARAWILPAQVEIALAAGDVDLARAAAAQLEEVVDSYMIGGGRAIAFDAAVHFARGQIELTEADPDAAERSLRRARQDWEKVGAPYEIGQARMLLGVALRRQGDEQAATSELEAALAAFERLGARLDEERVKELLGRVTARRTFLFTDIVDSTKLLSTLGDDKWRRLLARHDELVREQIVDAGGDVIKKTGDGFFASFESPKAAIEAAVGVQRALDGEIVAPDVRIGVHSGGAFRTGTDSADYGGQGVHVAARIGAAAGAREILVSRDTLDGIGSSFRASEPRALELKGFDEPVDVVGVDWR
jgi:class 3 adenylate cyclase